MPDNDETLTNGFDIDAALAFIGRIETLQAEIDEVLERAKAEAEPIRQDIAAVKREAMDQGVGKRELAAVLKRRRLERQAARADEHLDLAQKANFAEMIDALERVAEKMGPLGEAALERARAAG